VIIFISGLGEQLTYPEIVGASVVAGAGVLLVGMLGLSAYLASWVPTPIMFGHWLSSPSKFDSMYREGSPDYRAGRDVGRIVIYLIGVYEISQGVTVGLGAGSAIGPTGGATATSCALAETGVGAIGCLLGGVALTVEVGAVAGSAVAVAHGAGMIVYAAAHPPGSSGSGSGDLGGRSTSGPLQASDLDIKGEIASFDATYEFTDDTMTIRVRMIEGEIENPFEVVQNAMEFARSKGASVLRLEASIVNEQLYRIAQRRYGLVTQGGTDFIVIPLD